MLCFDIHCTIVHILYNETISVEINGQYTKTVIDRDNKIYMYVGKTTTTFYTVKKRDSLLDDWKHIGQYVLLNFCSQQNNKV